MRLFVSKCCFTLPPPRTFSLFTSGISTHIRFSKKSMLDLEMHLKKKRNQHFVCYRTPKKSAPPPVFATFLKYTLQVLHGAIADTPSCPVTVNGFP